MQRHINTMLSTDGCLVVQKRNKNKLFQRDLIIVPESLSEGLLVSMHLNLNHPTPYQLSKVIETRFFILDRDNKIKNLSSNCALCQAGRTIPKEIYEFDANDVPDHPGKSFTVDILRKCKKFINV